MALPTEEQEIINSKQLYNQFMRLVEGKNINFVTQAQAKQQQHSGFNKHDNDEMSLSWFTFTI